MAVVPTIATAGMTIEDFIRRYDSEGPFELIEGEIKPVMPTVAGHNVTVRAVFRPLDAYAATNKLGEVFTEAPFVLTDTPNWVKGSRVPDVMFFSAERMATYKQETPDWLTKPFVIVPDLAVEIVSPGDKHSEVEEKVALYLQDGVRMVWVIDPQIQLVKVYRLGSNHLTRLTAADTLDGGDVLLGFQLAIKDLFV